jgi:hypothetical protein
MMTAADAAQLLGAAAEDRSRTIAAEREWYEDQLASIKVELNDMATMGVAPMWGLLISRLEQLIADAKARHQ